jgi:hypothetical protein
VVLPPLEEARFGRCGVYTPGGQVTRGARPSSALDGGGGGGGDSGQRRRKWRGHVRWSKYTNPLADAPYNAIALMKVCTHRTATLHFNCVSPVGGMWEVTISAVLATLL